MKKLSLLLAVVFALCLVAGCGPSGANTSNSPSAAGSPAASGSPSPSETGTDAPPSESSSADAPPADPEQVYEWKLGTIYTDPASGIAFNAFGDWVQKLCELTEEKTNGAVKITPYYGSILGTNPEMYEQMRRGELEVFCGQPMSTIDPRFGITSIPYVFTDYQMVHDLVNNPDGEIFKLLQEVVADTGGYLVASNDAVFRGFYSNDKMVLTPDDLQGVKMRIYEDKVCQTFWEGTAAAPAIISYSETFMSLQTGVVDATEHTYTAGITANFYEVTNNLSLINWQWTWGGPAIVNTEVWNSLPADLQAQVTEAFWEASTYYDDVWATMEQEAIDAMQLEPYNITVAELTDEQMQQWVDYSRSLDETMKEVVGAEFWDQCMAIIDAYEG